MKILQEIDSEPNDIQRRINQMIHLKQPREEVFNHTPKIQEKIEKIYEKKTKVDDFKLGDIVLRWDARSEDKGKHGKFDNLWKVAYKIIEFRRNKEFLLEYLDGKEILGGTVNGRFLKHYLTWSWRKMFTLIVSKILFNV